MFPVFQIGSESGVPGGGMTAGLLSAPACVRVIIRDVAGKHSWDSAVLYGPPLCSLSSPAHTLLTQTQSPHCANLQLHTPPGGPPKKMELKEEGSEGDGQEEEEGKGMEGDRQEFHLEGELQGEERKVNDEEKAEPEGEGEEEEEEDEEEREQEEAMTEQQSDGESGSEQLLAPPLAKRVCREAVPAWDSLKEEDDALDEMLQYLGYSSPECLQRAGTRFPLMCKYCFFSL